MTTPRYKYTVALRYGYPTYCVFDAANDPDCQQPWDEWPWTQKGDTPEAVFAMIDGLRAAHAAGIDMNARHKVIEWCHAQGHYAAACWCYDLELLDYLNAMQMVPLAALHQLAVRAHVDSL